METKSKNNKQNNESKVGYKGNTIVKKSYDGVIWLQNVEIM